MKPDPFDPGVGKLSFAAFMEGALFHPEQGYYSCHIGGVGKRGDFTTSAMLGGALARALAGWIQDSRRRHPGLRHLIEVGPGDGTLARQVWGFLPWWRRWGCHYHLVDRSGPLREQQEKRLKGRSFHWHESIESALREAGGEALVFSNELIDAFPCRVWRWEGTWKELFLERRNDGWNEAWEVPEDGNGPFFSPDKAPRHGQRMETHETARDWLKGWLPLLRRGEVLTIDYALPSRVSLGGTLRAYFRQMRLEGDEVYRRMGKQDITADVRFEDLQFWGESAGMRTEFLLSQTAFIRKFGAPSTTDADAYVADPSGAGEAFQVLCQSRG